jgi:transcriptional regulator with XRE-family HTH domain
MAIDKKQLGSAIKQVRNARGLSQVELARIAGMSGSGNSVALIERGERFVSLDSLNALAKALDIPSACLTILGSTSMGRGKEVNELMQSLKGLITSTLFAQAELRVENDGEKAKQASVRDIGTDLAALKPFSRKRIPKKQDPKETPLSKKVRKMASKKDIIHS